MPRLIDGVSTLCLDAGLRAAIGRFPCQHFAIQLHQIAPALWGLLHFGFQCLDTLPQRRHGIRRGIPFGSPLGGCRRRRLVAVCRRRVCLARCTRSLGGALTLPAGDQFPPPVQLLLYPGRKQVIAPRHNQRQYQQHHRPDTAPLLPGGALGEILPGNMQGFVRSCRFRRSGGDTRFRVRRLHHGGGLSIGPGIQLHRGRAPYRCVPGDPVELKCLALVPALQRRGRQLRQRFAHRPAGLKAVLGLFRHDFVEKRLIAGQRGRQRGNGLSEMLDPHRHRRIRFEGHFAQQQVVEQDTQAVEIGTAIHLRAPGLLRAHIMGRAQSGTGTGHGVVRARSPGNSKVHQDSAAVLLQQHDVLGFDIPVHVALAAGVVQRHGHFLQYLEDALRGQGGQQLLEVPAVDVLHRQVVVAVFDTDVVNGDDVGVHQLADDARLAQETLAEILFLGQFRRHHLERHLALKAFLDRQIDGRHAPLPDGAHDAIARYGNADGLLPLVLVFIRQLGFIAYLKTWVTPPRLWTRQRVYPITRSGRAGAAGGWAQTATTA